MPDELAVYLRTAERVRSLGDLALKVCGDGAPVRGSDIVSRLSEQLPASLRAPFLWLLVNEGIAERLEGAASIDGYLLNVDPNRLRDYFEDQVRAAEVIERAERRTGSPGRDSRQVEVVATLPPELFPRSDRAEPGSIEPAIKRVIASGRETVWIVNPFFDPFGMVSLVPSIAGAADRGVSVRLITRGSEEQKAALRSAFDAIRGETRATESISRVEARDLLKRDATGRLQYALHSKVVLADEKACYVGSANLTEHGMRHNFELGVVLQGAVVREVKALLQRLWDVSEPLWLDSK